MADEGNQVYEANEAFYKAFEAMDMAAMESIWLKEDYIQCIHPGWALLAGREPVMASWRRIFQSTEGFRFLLTDVKIQVRDGLAWLTLHENITSRVRGESSSGVVLATNIYEKRPEGWFMIHHHGSPTLATPVETQTFH